MVEYLLLIPFLAGVFLLGEGAEPEDEADDAAPDLDPDAPWTEAGPTVFFGRGDTTGTEFASDAFGLLDADAPEGTLYNFDPYTDVLRLEYTGAEPVSLLQSWVEGNALVLLLSTGALLRLPGLQNLPPERIRIVPVPI